MIWKTIAVGILSSVLWQQVTAHCPSGWKYFEGTHSCFEFTARKGNFYESDQYCHSVGGHVASLVTIGETEFVKGLILADGPPSNHHLPYLGLTADAMDCNFVWLDGTPLNKSVVNFAARQPDRCRVRDTCVNVRLSTDWVGNNGILNDINCVAQVYRRLCKKPATPNRTPVAIPCDAGWIYHKETKSCFKDYIRGVTFEEASSHCKSFGAYLASITTDGEMQLVKEIVKNGQGKSFRELTIIGLSSPRKNCEYEWLDGTPLNKSIINWNKGEPNWCQGLHCVAVDYHGRWAIQVEPRDILDDYTCTFRRRKFLCKKNAVLEEEVKCKTGWIRLKRTNTCIENVASVRKVRDPESALRRKCEGLPMRTYFDSTTATCFVQNDHCHSVEYPAPLMRNANVDDIRRLWESRKIIERSSQICAFGQSPLCRVGETGKNGRCLWLTKKAVSWSAASTECQKEDGSLFVPHNDRDMQNAMDYLTINKPSSAAVFLGLVSTDEWRAMDGSDIDYLRWITQNTEEASVTTALFLYEKVSEGKLDGSYAAYMRMEFGLDGRFIGLCSRQG